MSTGELNKQQYDERGAAAVHRVIVDVLSNFDQFLVTTANLTEDGSTEELCENYHNRLKPLCTTWREATPQMKNAAKNEWKRVLMILDEGTDENFL